LTTRTYKVAGLACIDCAGRIQAAVGQLEGVENCLVDHVTGKLTVWLTTPDFDDASVVRIVADTGHILARESRRSANLFVRFMLSQRDTVLTAVAGLLTLMGIGLSVASLPDPWAWIPFALAILVGGYPVARHAFQEVFVARSLGINALMVIAVTGAIFIGEWAEAAIVVVLFALGEALEGYAAERARGALESLLELAPPTALRLCADGSTEEIAVESLQVGERVRVRPGDRVSVDGVVRGGQSAVDQAAITGESVPVDKSPGDAVFAGTVNTFGALEVEVTRLAADNTLSRMIALVREAQAQQSPVQRTVERFARVYTPAVAITALLIAIVPPLLFAQPFGGPHGWLVRALQMLVIACPCALVISTPVSVVSALTNAAGRGVLVKGGRALEALGRVRTFAFDKTGTLTVGRPVATDVLDVCAEPGCRNGLQYAAAVEAQSSHPLAQAVVTTAQARQIAVPPADDVAILAGRGITGRVNGKRVTVASHPYFDDRVPHTDAICGEAERLAADGKTVMLVSHEGAAESPEAVCAVFAVADAPRPESREVLATLREHHAIHTVMLTGDSIGVAQAIGRQLGVDEVRADLLPEDKVRILRELQGEEETVLTTQNPQPTPPNSQLLTPNSQLAGIAFVGDGVNDAPALAQATVGIAMGGAGSQQAMETADIVLMGDDLRQLPFLVALSRRTQQTIQGNIVFALGIKALVFGLAAAGAATLWMAIVADVGASLAVILNGLRLRRGG